MTILSLLLVARAPGAAASGSSDPNVISARVLRVSDEQPIVWIDAGSGAGIALGHPAWILQDAAVRSAGEVFLVSTQGAAIRLAEQADIQPGSPVVIVRLDRLVSLRDMLPPGVTVRGEVRRLAPGRHSAWVDLGRLQGLRPGDGLFVRRRGIPIARGRVSDVGEIDSLATLQPVVGNAVVEIGDLVELWPEPADQRLGRLHTTILATQPSDEGTMVTVAGTAADGFREDRLMDLMRDGDWLGVLAITDVFNPISRARTVHMASRGEPTVGDEAWLRSPPTQPPAPLEAAVFRVEPDQSYGLIAAGEVDGLRVGEKLLVRRPDPGREGHFQDVAELTVDKVNVDYSGAFIRPLDPGGEQVAQWDTAVRREPTRPIWTGIGMVQVVHPSRAASADIDIAAPLSPGQVVRLKPEIGRAGAGIVLARAKDRALLYIPVGWGETGAMLHARLERPDKPEPTLPATTPALPEAPPE